MTLLSVRGVSVRAGGALVCEDVSFDIGEGQSFGLVGESGCGKTTTAKAILGLLPGAMRLAAGSIRFRGTELAGLPRPEMNKLRWRQIALVTQSAMNALDPVSRVGAQTERLFEQVGLDAAWTRRYPHEFSGGMRQRAIIAMALACEPALIIADEPTTALDVIIQDEVFDLLARIRAGGQRAMLLISHDLALVAENCDRVAVMYAGQIIEAGPSAAVFGAASHPYTIGLQSAFPDIGDTAHEVIAIPGSPPSGQAGGPGCRFAPRCPFAEPLCHDQTPDHRMVGPDHTAACHFAGEAARFRALGAVAATWDRLAPA
jgi:oligopeptide/dipeptide ABC transporter ATP-binding protein